MIADWQERHKAVQTLGAFGYREMIVVVAVREMTGNVDGR